MTVTNVTRDVADLRLTVVARFDAPVERIWRLWEDPRQLERWWGPPGYPATVVTHDLVPGGEVRYYMTAPEGDRYHGWWRIRSVDGPHLLEFTDGFGESDAASDGSMPTSDVRVELADRDGGGTEMRIISTFASREDMDRIIEMGAEEGMRAALDQIDDLLREGSPAG